MVVFHSGHLECRCFRCKHTTHTSTSCRPFSFFAHSGLLPFLLLHLVKALKRVARLIRRRRNKKEKKKNQKGTKPPTTSNVGSKQPTIVNSTGSVDKVDKVKTKNLKPKFPCSLCKGDHFLRDFPGIPKVLEMWYSTSSASFGHASDTLSTSS
jgi:hypothetical protein